MLINVDIVTKEYDIEMYQTKSTDQISSYYANSIQIRLYDCNRFITHKLEKVRFKHFFYLFLSKEYFFCNKSAENLLFWL